MNNHHKQQKSSKRHPKPYPPTMRELLEIERERMNNTLWNRAETASRIAKLAFNKRKKVLYNIKDQCFITLLHHDALTMAADNTFDPPLISAIYGSKRLHTSVHWLQLAAPDYVLPFYKNN